MHVTACAIYVLADVGLGRGCVASGVGWLKQCLKPVVLCGRAICCLTLNEDCRLKWL